MVREVIATDEVGPRLFINPVFLQSIPMLFTCDVTKQCTELLIIKAPREYVRCSLSVMSAARSEFTLSNVE